MPDRKSLVRVPAVLLNAAGIETQRYEGLPEAMAEAKELAEATESSPQKESESTPRYKPSFAAPRPAGGALALDSLQPSGKPVAS